MTTAQLGRTLTAAGPRRVALVALGFGDPPQRPDIPTVDERDRDAVFTALAAELAHWLQGRSPDGELSGVLVGNLAEVPGPAVRAVAASLCAKDDPILAALGWELVAALALIDADLVLLDARRRALYERGHGDPRYGGLVAGPAEDPGEAGPADDPRDR